MKFINSILAIFFIVLIFISCKEDEKRILSGEEINYNKTIAHIRESHDFYMKTNPNSPFNAKSKVDFKPLKYFEPNMEYIFKSKLFLYESQDSVTILGTQGDERKFIRYGYFNIEYKNENYKLNVYQGYEPSIGAYYGIWFTDETTNKETYGVGRYLNMRIIDDPDHIYTIDFNAAYNPYCAYSKEFTCAIPRKEDHIGFAIKAGEKKFHD